jgi:hypothetical protein
MASGGIIKHIISRIWEGIVLVLLMEGIYAIKMGPGGMIYLQSFIRADTNVQAIRFHVNNLKGCNIHITDGRGLWCTPLKWPQVAWYMYQVP